MPNKPDYRAALRLLTVIFAGLVIVLGMTPAPLRAADAVFSNTNAITTTFDQEAGSPYPSTINVSQMYGTIVDVDVTLFGVTRLTTGYLDVLLVSPSGQKVILMASACIGDYLDNIDLTFDDSAESQMDSLFCTGGRYQPTDYQAAANPTNPIYNLVSPAAPPITR